MYGVNLKKEKGGAMKIVIYLIEDNPEDMKKIIADLNHRAHDKFNTPENEYEFKPLEGTNRENYNEREWLFYDSRVIDRIKEILSEEKKRGNRMGLLLDVLLTKEDMENSLSAYYPTASIARKIYTEFNQKMPIHIITNLLMFGTQSEIIMGADLADSYIVKEALEYPFDDDVAAMFKKYRDWKEL